MLTKTSVIRSRKELVAGEWERTQRTGIIWDSKGDGNGIHNVRKAKIFSWYF